MQLTDEQLEQAANILADEPERWHTPLFGTRPFRYDQQLFDAGKEIARWLQIQEAVSRVVGK